MTSAQDRLDNSPELRAKVDKQIAAGVFEGFASDDGLEAIVQRVGRPPLLVKDGRVVFGTGVDDSLDDFPDGTDALIVAAEPWIASVGRVEFKNAALAWGGTGWVIGAEGDDRIVVTNRHVAEIVARRSPSGRGVFLRNPAQMDCGAAIDFNEEYGSTQAQALAFAVVSIPYLADATEPDVAFLRITGDDLPSPLELAETDAVLDDLVALIGYPAHDDRNDAGDMSRYFRDLYNVKRFAPGKIIQELGPDTALQHDCTSLGGNSGSPLLRLSDLKVVGLHFSGMYGKYNTAVGARTLRTLLAGARPVITAPADAPHTEGASDGVHTPEQLADRAGFDTEFLGAGALETPWPQFSDEAAADLVAPSDATEAKPLEIRYTHFGVHYSRSRRQPMMTAVNIDGAHFVPIKRGNDKWFKDGRIPLDVQLDQRDYADPKIDRGHMVRRMDPNWDADLIPGKPSALAQQANDDTFHYTNSAVQHGDLNQSAKLWVGLEEYVLSSASTHGFKACVFTGPITRDSDLPIADGVIAPQEFFKVVVMPGVKKGTLHATAYVLSQGEMIRDLLKKRTTEAVEGFVYGAYRTFQVPIADLIATTGFDFSVYVPFDPLGEAGTQEGVDRPRYIVLDDEQQIFL